MACGTGFCAGKLIAAVVAVGVGGYAAFNYTTTGCVLGSGDKASSVQEVAATDAASGCCQAKPACDGSDCGTGCADCAAEAALLEVAATTEAAEGEACSEAKTCDETKTCPLTGEVMEVAATEGAECQKACEGKTECTTPAEEVAVDSEAQKSDG